MDDVSHLFDRALAFLEKWYADEENFKKGIL